MTEVLMTGLLNHKLASYLWNKPEDLSQETAQ